MSKINLDLIRKKLGEIESSSKSSTGSKDRVDYIFKPKAKGTYHVRLLPYKYNSENPFTEIQVYNYLDKGVVSPSNWNEPDPILEIIDELNKKSWEDKKAGVESISWDIIKAIRPTARIYVPVLVREQEAEGVKFWRLTKDSYIKLLKIVTNEEVGDVFDFEQGRDIVAEYVPTKKDARYLQLDSINPRMKTSELHHDPRFIKDLLENQIDVLEENKRFKKDYMTMKSLIDEYISTVVKPDIIAKKTGQKPSTEAQVNVQVPTSQPMAEQASYVSDKPKGMAAAQIPADAMKKNPMDEFDMVFNEDEE